MFLPLTGDAQSAMAIGIGLVRGPNLLALLTATAARDASHFDHDSSNQTYPYDS